MLVFSFMHFEIKMEIQVAISSRSSLFVCAVRLDFIPNTSKWLFGAGIKRIIFNYTIYLFYFFPRYPANPTCAATQPY